MVFPASLCSSKCESGSLPGNHNEQAAISACSKRHSQFDYPSGQPATELIRNEQLFGFGERLEWDSLGYALNEGKPRLLEPAKHFTDGVLGFMRILVLIHMPGTFPGVADILGHPLIQVESVPRQSEKPAADVRTQPGIFVVQADQDVALRLNQRGNRAKREKWVRRMMQHAVRDHQIELPGPETGAKQIHLKKVGSLQIISFFKNLSHSERVHAHVDADYSSTRDGQEIRELARPTPAVDDACSKRDLVIQHLRKYPLPGFLYQDASVVKVVVVRKGIRFVERLHRLRHIPLRLTPFCIPEQLGNVIDRWVKLTARQTSE